MKSENLGRIVGIVLVVVAALYLFVGALLEQRFKRGGDGAIVGITSVSRSNPEVIVITRDGHLYRYSLGDSTWRVSAQVPDDR